jgi:hypothetical protein
MKPTQVAIYARVSSEQRAEAHTVASQVAALRERVAADGLTVSEAMQFLEGFVNLLRLISSQGKRGRSPGPSDLLSDPLRARNLGPTREALPHLGAVRRCRQ